MKLYSIIEIKKRQTRNKRIDFQDVTFTGDTQHLVYKIFKNN